MLGLALWITECYCTCGNVWTHSYPILRGDGALGGTPGPKEERELPLTHILTSKRSFTHCFSCVPPNLGVGWEAAAVQTAAKGPGSRGGYSTRSRAPDLSLIEKDIF